MAQDYGFGSIGGDPLAGMIGSMEQMRRMWAGIGVPGSLAPTIDPKELERRIADLRVIEQWLEANLAMLRSTIQALEMQHGALAALQSIGESLASAMPSQSTAAPGPARASRREPGADGAPDAPPGSDAPEAAGFAAAGTANTQPEPHAAASAGPAGWWELLQGQFNQIARTALGAASLAGEAPSDPGAAKARAAGAAAGKRTGRRARPAKTARAAKAKPARAAKAKPARAAKAESGPAVKAKAVPPAKAKAKPAVKAQNARAQRADPARGATAPTGSARGATAPTGPAPAPPTPAAGPARSAK